MITLLNDSKEDKWTPLSIDTIRNAISLPMNYSIEKNIAYNIQYLQFISKQLNELRLTSVLKKMLYKTYIITGMAVLEAIFYCALKEKGYLAKESWKTEKKYISNEIGPDDNRTRIVSEVQKKYEPEEVRQNLDSLINKVKSKKIFSTKIITSDLLENYRELRNKIHIYICNDTSESDYNSFKEIDYVVMKVILKKFIYDDVVTKKDKRKDLDIIFGNAENELDELLKG